MVIVTLNEAYVELKLFVNTVDEGELSVLDVIQAFALGEKKATRRIEERFSLEHTFCKEDIRDGIRTIRLPKCVGLDLITRLEVPYDDIRVIPGHNTQIDYKSNVILSPNQSAICDSIEKGIRGRKTHNYTYVANSITGKCLGYGTKIIMYDGTTKDVQNVILGDLLMGDDSTSRRVLSLGVGVADMYEISNCNGDVYITNGEHLLCLKCCIKAKVVDIAYKYIYLVKWFDHLTVKNKTTRFTYKDKNKEDVLKESLCFLDKKTHQNNNDVIISVTNYLKLSKTLRNRLKGYKVCIDFDDKQVDIDPYLIGLNLGSINAVNHGINAVKHGINTVKRGNINIPYQYKFNSRRQRLKLLAGIIDGCGYVNNNSYAIPYNNRTLINDVMYLTRSLGYSSYIIGDKLIIYGSGLDVIPVVVLKPLGNKTNKSVLKRKITIKPLGVRKYYGFVLSGNHKYMLGDFTVTHNTTIAAGMMSRLKVKTLIIVPSLLLLEHWRTELTNSLNIIKDEVLILGRKRYIKNRSYVNKRNKKYKVILLAVCTSHDIDASLLLKGNNVFLTIYDEIQAYNAEGCMEVFWNTQSYYNLGLTDASRANGNEETYTRHIHSKTHEYEIVPGISHKYYTGVVEVVCNAEMHNADHDINGNISKRPMITDVLCGDAKRSAMIVNRVLVLYDENNSHCICILSDRCEHLKVMAKMLSDMRPEVVTKILIGKSKEVDIKDANLRSRIIFMTYHYIPASIIIQKMNCLVLATPRKTKFEDILNIILRNGLGSRIVRKIVDIVDVDVKCCLGTQFDARRIIYNRKGFKLEYVDVYGKKINSAYPL